MKITYDQRVDALYIYLTDEQPVASSEVINDDVVLDLDEHGKVIGIEVLNARRSNINPYSVEIQQLSESPTAQ